MLGKLGFQVGGLVPVDHVALGQLIKHADYLGILFGSRFLIGGPTQFLNGVPGGTGIILVSHALRFGLPDPFLR